MNALLNWLDDRIGYKQILHEALYENIPGGSRWRYVWGSTLVFTFAVQVITGIFLWTAYSPSAQTAWESVYYIQNVMTFGWLVRGIHHFAAQAMVVLMALHLMQVIIDGAYKAPREVNFWLGLILMQIVLGLSLTGYLLPWDQKGYYATQVSTKIMGATPIVGSQLQLLVQGGPEYGHHTLTRFFAMHAGILPGSLVAFLVLHIYVFRRHGITVPDPNHGPSTTFWPDQVLKDGVACLAVLATVLLLTIYKGAELAAPADASEAFSAARPEWYFLFLFRFLKFEAVEHIGLAFGAIYVPGLLMTILAAMPIIAWWKKGHAFNVAFMAVMIVAIVVLTGMAWYEDKNSADFQAAVGAADVDAHRVRELATQPTGIPASGAVTLLRNDPFTQGPKSFAKSCSSCHRYNGHDGTGRQVVEKDKSGQEREAVATATDLGTFGKRAWMRSILLNYTDHFAPLTKANWYKGLKKKADAGDNVSEIFLDPTVDASDMAAWSDENKETLAKTENKESLDALIEFLVAQSNRPDVTVDTKLAAKGLTLATEDGTALAVGELSSVCTDCHELEPGAKFVRSEEEGSGYPVLTGYGSYGWLKDFISNPASQQHYAAKNQMPAFGERLTERQLDLLVRWMLGDYYRGSDSTTHVESASE